MIALNVEKLSLLLGNSFNQVIGGIDPWKLNLKHLTLKESSYPIFCFLPLVKTGKKKPKSKLMICSIMIKKIALKNVLGIQMVKKFGKKEEL